MEPTTIGVELKRLRQIKGVTLRQVETDTEVSNAYLSQLENGKAGQPSPRILHTLAEYYGSSYMDLMQMAGYVETPKAQQIPAMRFSANNQALMGSLTADEEEFLVGVLRLYRKEKAAEND